MSLEVSRPPILGFDGLHRTGKGTQAELLAQAIAEAGGTSITVRGDGTREGLGLHAGDPYSEEWQQRGAHLKTAQGGTVEGWNAASYLLMRELWDLSSSKSAQNYDAILVDRTVISRAAFLLHRGIGMEGQRLSLDSLYPDNSSVPPDAQLDLGKIIPDAIFDLQVDSPQDLLERLDPQDPKFTFRARNIKGGFRPAKIARQHLPDEVEQRVVTLDATQEKEQVFEKVISHLASTALIKCLR